MSPEKRILGRSIRLSADMSGGDDQPTIAINCPAVVFMNDAGPNGLAGTSRNGGRFAGWRLIRIGHAMAVAVQAVPVTCTAHR